MEPLLVHPDPPPPELARLLDLGGHAWKPVADERAASSQAPDDGWGGAIVVVGHTDNIPVGAGSPLGDNMAISLARARSAAQMLQRHIDDPARVTFEGRGANDPILPNTSAENRARNRRVEFQIPAEKTQ